MDFPDDRLYSQHHLWIKRNDSMVVIGLTDYAVDELGQADFLELPESGQTVARDKPFGVIETSKAITDLIAPISGTVVEVNREALENPALVTERPYQEGWLLELTPASSSELELLIQPQRYREMVVGEDG